MRFGLLVLAVVLAVGETGAAWKSAKSSSSAVDTPAGSKIGYAISKTQEKIRICDG